MTVSPVASSEKIQTALTNLGTPNGFIAYDVVPLMQQLVVALGNITSGGGGSAITGEGRLWFSDTPPTGWLICDGSVLNVADYPDLYAVIGVNYGGTVGLVFNLPDLRNRAPVGKGSGYFPTLGTTIGSETINLTSLQVPSLSTTDSGATSGGDFQALTSVSYSGSPSTDVNVIQPSLVVNFIIKT